jgi:hypothetical protein
MTNKCRIAAVIAAFALVLVASPVFASGNATGDKSILVGDWKVVQGTYPDGSLEKELEMGFSFTATTLTNPMDGSILSYSMDEKAKTISGSDATSSIIISYKIVDKKTVDFVSMTVTAKGKSTVIVGKEGMFSSLRLGRK